MPNQNKASTLHPPFSALLLREHSTEGRVDLFLNVSGHVIFSTLKWTPESDIMLKTPTMNTLALVMREKAEDFNRNPSWKYLRGLGLNHVQFFSGLLLTSIMNQWRTAIELNG